MATTYVVPNADLSLYDLKRLYLYLTMMSPSVRYHPDKYCFECELDVEEFEKRMTGPDTDIFIRGYCSDPLNVILNGPEEDMFTVE